MKIRRSNGRGTAVVRIAFRGVGQIERASGFADPAMVPRLKEMLRVLFESGRADDLLRAVQTGRITLRQVWAVYRAGAWQRLPTPEHALPFGETFDAWQRKKPSLAYRKAAAWARAGLERTSVPVTLADLPRACLLYRASCDSAKTGAMFNRALAYFRTFCAETITTQHPIAVEVAALEDLPELVKRPKQPRRPEEAAAIRETLGADVGAMWWALCCSGMLPDEYFANKWAIEDGRLHIKGTKREARDRIVPLLGAMPEPVGTLQQFQRALRAAGVGVRPKDGRDSFALWCDLAGISFLWREALLGHARGKLDYGWQETERIFDECETRLTALLERGTNRGTAVVNELVSASAPRKTRTPSLLIRSQARPSTRPKTKHGQDPQEPIQTHENPPNSGGHAGGHE